MQFQPGLRAGRLLDGYVGPIVSRRGDLDDFAVAFAANRAAMQFQPGLRAGRLLDGYVGPIVSRRRNLNRRIGLAHTANRAVIRLRSGSRTGRLNVDHIQGIPHVVVEPVPHLRGNFHAIRDLKGRVGGVGYRYDLLHEFVSASHEKVAEHRVRARFVKELFKVQQRVTGPIIAVRILADIVVDQIAGLGVNLRRVEQSRDRAVCVPSDSVVGCVNRQNEHAVHVHGCDIGVLDVLVFDHRFLMYAEAQTVPTVFAERRFLRVHVRRDLFGRRGEVRVGVAASLFRVQFCGNVEQVVTVHVTERQTLPRERVGDRFVPEVGDLDQQIVALRILFGRVVMRVAFDVVDVLFENERIEEVRIPVLNAVFSVAFVAGHRIPTRIDHDRLIRDRVFDRIAAELADPAFVAVVEQSGFGNRPLVTVRVGIDRDRDDRFGNDIAADRAMIRSRSGRHAGRFCVERVIVLRGMPECRDLDRRIGIALVALRAVERLRSGRHAGRLDVHDVLPVMSGRGDLNRRIGLAFAADRAEIGLVTDFRTGRLDVHVVLPVMSGRRDQDDRIGFACAADRAVIGLGSVGRTGRRNIHRIFGAVYVVVRNDAIPERGGDLRAVVHRVGVSFGIRNLFNRHHEALAAGDGEVGDRKVSVRPGQRFRAVHLERDDRVFVRVAVNHAAVPVGLGVEQFGFNVRKTGGTGGEFEDRNAVDVTGCNRVIVRQILTRSAVEQFHVDPDADAVPAPFGIVLIGPSDVRIVGEVSRQTAHSVRSVHLGVVDGRSVVPHPLERAGEFGVARRNAGDGGQVIERFRMHVSDHVTVFAAVKVQDRVVPEDRELDVEIVTVGIIVGRIEVLVAADVTQTDRIGRVLAAVGVRELLDLRHVRERLLDDLMTERTFACASAVLQKGGRFVNGPVRDDVQGGIDRNILDRRVDDVAADGAMIGQDAGSRTGRRDLHRVLGRRDVTFRRDLDGGAGNTYAADRAVIGLVTDFRTGRLRVDRVLIRRSMCVRRRDLHGSTGNALSADDAVEGFGPGDTSLRLRVDRVLIRRSMGMERRRYALHSRKSIPGLQDAVEPGLLMRDHLGVPRRDVIGVAFVMLVLHQIVPAVRTVDHAEQVVDRLVASVEDAFVDDVEHPVGALVVGHGLVLGHDFKIFLADIARMFGAVLQICREGSRLAGIGVDVDGAGVAGVVDDCVVRSIDADLRAGDHRIQGGHRLDPIVLQVAEQIHAEEE